MKKNMCGDSLGGQSGLPAGRDFLLGQPSLSVWFSTVKEKFIHRIGVKLGIAGVLALLLTFFDHKASEIQNFGFAGNTYLSAELSTEASSTLPDSLKAIDKYRSLIKDALDLYSSQKFACLAKIGTKELNPVVALKEALGYLKSDPTSESDARKQIDNAACALRKYVQAANVALSESDIDFVPKGNSAEKLALDAKMAINAFHSAVTNLQSNPSFASATDACLASREAGTLFQLSWSRLQSSPDYQSLTKQFAADLEIDRKLTEGLVETVTDEKQKTALLKYTQSLARREFALHGIVQKNFVAVRRKLLEDSAKCTKHAQPSDDNNGPNENQK